MLTCRIGNDIININTKNKVINLSEYIYKNIKKLQMPVGYFKVVSIFNESIPFSIVKNPYDYPYPIYDDSDQLIEEISIDTNYKLIIETENLSVGSMYQVFFSGGNLNYSISDEHTEAITTLINGWTVGIGMYNPNDEEELKQAIRYSKEKGFYQQHAIIHPPQYDESKFSQYVIKNYDQSGYWFKLLDKSVSTISFFVAWMENKNLPDLECDSAIGYWLT